MMTTNAIPNELSSTFLDVISSIRSKVNYNSKEDNFSLATDASVVDYDYIENLLTDELAETEFHYDNIGEDEFQRLFEFGITALSDSNSEIEEATKVNFDGAAQNEEEEEEEVEEYEEEDESEEYEEEESEENAESLHFDFISEIIEEVKANPETDTDYIEVRIKNGLKTRGIEITLNI